MRKLTTPPLKSILCLLISTQMGWGRGTLQGTPSQRVIGHLNAKGTVKACDLALTACKDVVKAQDDSITTLKASVTTLEDKLADATKPPLLPTWAVILLGVATGVVVGTVLHK